MSILTRPVLEINLNNLLDNYITLKNIANNAVAAAVIKDDAYGLGAEKIAKMLHDKAECRNFFVAHAVEGEKIAKILNDVTIYVLQGIGDDSLDIFKHTSQLVPVISSPQMFEFWKKNKIDRCKPAIQIETGLNRLGFRENEIEKLTDDERKMFSLVMSHLACGDEKEHFMNKHQIETFDRLKKKYFNDLPASLSASDGVFLGNDFHYDMVRLGAAMYGINTAPYRLNQMKNVVSIKAPILQIADLPKGDFVGYSATYRASSDKKIAIVSIGYGDGIPRSLSNVGNVFFCVGEKIYEANIIGRVSMDNIICDVSNIENLKCGDWGYLASDFYTLDDMARRAETISYEIMSRVGKNKRFDVKYT